MSTVGKRTRVKGSETEEDKEEGVEREGRKERRLTSRTLRDRRAKGG